MLWSDGSLRGGSSMLESATCTLVSFSSELCGIMHYSQESAASVQKKQGKVTEMSSNVHAQEHASSNPGLQAFLEKKSDEHIYSALYLLAGVFCLYAAIFHGENFCTEPPPPGLQVCARATLLTADLAAFMHQRRAAYASLCFVHGSRHSLSSVPILAGTGAPAVLELASKAGRK